MKKVKVYELSYSVDEAITGVDDRQITGFIDPENDSRKRTAEYQEIYYDLLGDDFDLTKFCADEGAKPTDFLSSDYLNTDGVFISSDFIKLLDRFFICSHKYRDVYIKHLSEKKDYRFLNLIMCPNINFKESSFVICDEVKDVKYEEIKLSSLQEFRDNINKLSEKKGYDFTIAPQKIVLNSTYDLFKYELSGEFLISESLKNALENSALTGYEIEPFNVDVYH